MQRQGLSSMFFQTGCRAGGTFSLSYMPVRESSQRAWKDTHWLTDVAEWTDLELWGGRTSFFLVDFFSPCVCSLTRRGLQMVLAFVRTSVQMLPQGCSAMSPQLTFRFLLLSSRCPQVIYGGARGKGRRAQSRMPEDEIRFQNLLLRQGTLCPMGKVASCAKAMEPLTAPTGAMSSWHKRGRHFSLLVFHHGAD